MTDYSETLARKIGRIDALLFFAIWACVGLVSATHPWGSIPIIIFLLVPASALVGWRGAASVRLILAGSASLRRAAIEGFCWGAAFVLAVWLWGASKSAFAAGGVLDDLSPLQAEFWYALSVTLLPALGIGAILGALHGIALFYFNRWLVRTNPPLNPDAPPNGGAPVS
jgi:hypothetical protein